MRRVNFLRHYHHRDRRFRACESSRDNLERDERLLPGRDRTQPREDRVAHHGVEQQATAPEYVGERRQDQRQQVAEPDYREHRTDMRFGYLETSLDLLQRETQQR